MTQAPSDVARLYVVAFPELSEEEGRWVAALRARHDAAGHALLGAHFTFVFGCVTQSVAELAQEVRAVSQATRMIDFVCNRAELDAQDNAAYVYLCPGEGAGAMRHLHERLHSGRLKPRSAPPRLFLPHMTVCKTTDAALARALASRLNADGVHVAGRIRSLQIGAVRGDRFETLAGFPLDSPVA